MCQGYPCKREPCRYCPLSLKKDKATMAVTQAQYHLTKPRHFTIADIQSGIHKPHTALYANNLRI